MIVRALAACLAISSTPVLAGSYRVVLQPGAGKMLVGHAGVQAVDERTSTALVRLISPGNEVDERGTIRVLVMNLGAVPFDFGPDQVKLTLSDGTVLKASSVEQYEKKRELVERESGRAATVDMQVRNSVASLEQQTNSSGPAIASGPSGSASAGSSLSDTAGQNRRTDENLQAGAPTLNAIYQILVTQPVAPNKAWGGYYVFDVPKAVFARRADQPLAITVRTGPEEHRFQAVLHWK